MRELERRVLLEVIDRKWREHLYEMDYLKDGVGLRAYAQRDPLVEYQREGFDMFNQMMDGVKEEAVGFLFNLEVQIEEPAEVEGVGAAPVALPKSTSPAAQRRQQQLLYSAPSIDGDGDPVMVREAPGGSGGSTPAGSALGAKAAPSGPVAPVHRVRPRADPLRVLPVRPVRLARVRLARVRSRLA